MPVAMRPEWWHRADSDNPGRTLSAKSQQMSKLTGDKFGLFWELERKPCLWPWDLYLLASQITESTEKVKKKNPICTHIKVTINPL